MLFDRLCSAKEFNSLTTLVFGFAKSGKTSLHHSYEKLMQKPPLFFLTEDGLGSLSAFGVRITKWEGFQKLISKCQRDNKTLKDEFGCIVVDLIGELDSMCMHYICRINGKESLGEIAHGKGYYMHSQIFKQGILDLLALGLPVKFIAHAKEKSFGQQVDGITLYEPDISKQSRHFILGKCDSIGFIEPSKSNGSNALSFNSSNAPDTGSRFPQIIKSYILNHSDLSESLGEISKCFKEDV